MTDGFFRNCPAAAVRRCGNGQSGLEPVDLPHDWLIGQKDLYESADAWYTRGIELPEDHEPVVLVRFDGVYMDCDVLLNGEMICTHPYGYTAFDVPLTGKAQNGNNQLTGAYPPSEPEFQMVFGQRHLSGCDSDHPAGRSYHSGQLLCMT